MKKSVLVPIEKYQRLIGNKKETREVGVETSEVVHTRGSQGNDESRKNLSDIETTPIPSETAAIESHEVNRVVPKISHLKASRAKRRNKVYPPGKKDYKFLWLKLNG